MNQGCPCPWPEMTYGCSNSFPMNLSFTCRVTRPAAWPLRASASTGQGTSALSCNSNYLGLEDCVMINKIFALPVIEQLTPVLSRRQLDDLDLIVVDHPQVKASLHYRARTFSPGNPLARKRYCGSVIIRLSKPAWRYAAVYRSAGLVWICGSTGSTVTRLCA